MNAPANPLATFDQLVTEAEACKRYPLLLSLRELRKARQNAEIAWTEGKKGVVLYHPGDLAEYLSSKSHRVSQCQIGSGNTVGIGSPAPTAPKRSTRTGTTTEDAQRVAERLAQKYSTRQKSA